MSYLLTKCDILLITQPLRSYTAEIPGGKIGKRKVISLKDPEQLVFVYYDRCTRVFLPVKLLICPLLKTKWDIQGRGRVTLVNSFGNLIVINMRLTDGYLKCNESVITINKKGYISEKSVYWVML